MSIAVISILGKALVDVSAIAASMCPQLAAHGSPILEALPFSLSPALLTVQKSQHVARLDVEGSFGALILGSP